MKNYPYPIAFWSFALPTWDYIARGTPGSLVIAPALLSREDFFADFCRSCCPQLPGELWGLPGELLEMPCSSPWAANSVLQVADCRVLRKILQILATEGPALPYKLKKTLTSVHAHSGPVNYGW